MNTELRRELRKIYEKGEMQIPQGWTFEDIMAYFEWTPISKRKTDTPYWADRLGKKIDKLTDATLKSIKVVEPIIQKIKRDRVEKARKQIKYYSESMINPLLFGYGTRDLVSKNDLTMGLHTRNLHIKKRDITERLTALAEEADKKGLTYIFRDCLQETLRISEGKGEDAVYTALEAFIDTFQKQLDHVKGVMKDYSKPGSTIDGRASSKRVHPLADGDAPKHYTADEDEETEKAKEIVPKNPEDVEREHKEELRREGERIEALEDEKQRNRFMEEQEGKWELEKPKKEDKPKSPEATARDQLKEQLENLSLRDRKLVLQQFVKSKDKIPKQRKNIKSGKR